MQAETEKKGKEVSSLPFPLPEGKFPAFQCTAILGVGLMGGSLGMALRNNQLSGRVIGFDTAPQALERALEMGAVDAVTADLSKAVSQADLVVVAAPVGAISDLFVQIAPLILRNALITDLGSVKKPVVLEGQRLFGDQFVSGHPMAGSERSGVEAARPDLYRNAAWAVIVSPESESQENSYRQRLCALIAALQARPVFLDAEQHDSLAAFISHLPHVLSFAFLATINSLPQSDMARHLAGGSYRDLIRVSAADAALWSDIFMHNQAALLSALQAYRAHLERIEQAIAAGDLEALRVALP